MVTMSRNDRHLSSGDTLSKDAIAPGVFGGLPYVVVRNGSQPAGRDGRTLLRPPWLTAAMASGQRAFVNRMVRRWISPRHSAPSVFHRRPNR